MPRSLLVFRTAMPDMKLSRIPWRPKTCSFDDWWSRPGTASLLVTEYNKYLWMLAQVWLTGRAYSGAKSC